MLRFRIKLIELLYNNFPLWDMYVGYLPALIDKVMF